MPNDRIPQPTLNANGQAWTHLLTQTGRTPRRSEIRELLAITANRSVIGFGGGLTAPELFPVEELVEALQRVLAERPAMALQYGPTEGLAELRQVIAERLSGRGIVCDAGDVLVTTGSQQALDLLGEALLAPGAPVVVERPTYVGALQAFGSHEPEFAGFPTDADGMQVDRVVDWLSENRRPALIYTVPTFQNPSGVTWSRARREALLELSDAAGVPVIEDDPYSELTYDGEPPAALRAMPGGREVVHLGTFSKVLSPGIRIGYVVAPKPLLERMVLIKQGRDLHTDALAQCMVAEFCRVFGLERHLWRLRESYRARRDVMLAALERRMPPGVTWTRPAGGMFLWVALPDTVDAAGLLPVAVRAGVSFVPGTAFHADGGGAHALRLNFTSSSVDEINEGIRILGDLVSERVPAA